MEDTERSVRFLAFSVVKGIAVLLIVLAYALMATFAVTRANGQINACVDTESLKTDGRPVLIHKDKHVLHVEQKKPWGGIGTPTTTMHVAPMGKVVVNVSVESCATVAIVLWAL